MIGRHHLCFHSAMDKKSNRPATGGDDLDAPALTEAAPGKPDVSQPDVSKDRARIPLKTIPWIPFMVTSQEATKSTDHWSLGKPALPQVGRDGLAQADHEPSCEAASAAAMPAVVGSGLPEVTEPAPKKPRGESGGAGTTARCAGTATEAVKQGAAKRTPCQKVTTL